MRSFFVLLCFYLCIYGKERKPLEFDFNPFGEKAEQMFKNMERIVGGNEVVAGSYPDVTWQVGLSMDVGGGRFRLCGGVIVTSEYVLTAGHCVKDISSAAQVFTQPSTIGVKVGIDRSVGASYTVAEYWVHPTWDFGVTPRSNRIDLGCSWVIWFLLLTLFFLAILKMVAPLPINGATVTTIPRCELADNCEIPGRTFVVSGYGDTTCVVGDCSNTVQQLRFIYQDFVDDVSCQAVWGGNGLGTLPITAVCAGWSSSNPGTGDSCFGDSGGPLVMDTGGGNFKLVGLVSTDTVPANHPTFLPCGQAGNYGVYVSVLDNQLYINNVLAGLINSTSSNPCVATNTCLPVNGGGGATDSWPWWYYALIALAAIVVIIILLVLCCTKCCGACAPKRHHQARAKPVVMQSRPAQQPPQQTSNTSFSVSVSPAPPPAQYQQPAPQPQVYNPNMYSPQQPAAVPYNPNTAPPPAPNPYGYSAYGRM